MSSKVVTFTGTAAELASKIRLNGNKVTPAQVATLANLGFGKVVDKVATGKRGRPQHVYEMRQNVRGLIEA